MKTDTIIVGSGIIGMSLAKDIPIIPDPTIIVSVFMLILLNLKLMIVRNLYPINI